MARISMNSLAVSVAIVLCSTGVVQAQLKTLAVTGDIWPEAGGAQIVEILSANMNDDGVVAANLEMYTGSRSPGPAGQQGIWKIAPGNRELLITGNVVVDGREYIFNTGDTEGVPSNYGDMLFTQMVVLGPGGGTLRSSPDGEWHAVLPHDLQVNGSDPLWTVEGRDGPDSIGNIISGGITRNADTDGRYRGIWLSQRDGTVQTLVHEGHTSLSSTDGRSLSAPGLVGANDAGIVYFVAATDAPGDVRRLGVWRLDTRAGGPAQEVLSPTFVLPGAGTLPGLANILRGVVNVNEQFAVMGSLRPLDELNTTSDDFGLWVQRNVGEVELVARGGETLPGYAGLGAVREFGDFTLQMNDVGDVLVMLGFGEGASRRQAWVLDRPGEEPVVVATDGVGGTNVADPRHGEAWLDAQGRAFVHSEIDGEQSIWMRGVDGTQTTIVRTGEIVEVLPGDFRRIAEINSWMSDVNDRGQVLIAATFDGGSQALLLSNVAVPEPAGMVLGAMGVIALAAVRVQRGIRR